MIVVVILTIIIDRLIVKYGCLSLYKGKWKKISRIKPNNIREKIFMTHLVKQANYKKSTIMADIILYNVSIIISIIYIYFLFIGKYPGFGLIWCIVVGIHLVLILVLNFLDKLQNK